MTEQFPDADILTPKSRLMDVLTPTTSKDEFEKLVDAIVTDNDRKMFGPNAKDFVIQSLSYPAAFPPKPDTFGSDAYAYVIDDVVANGGHENVDRTTDPERIDRLLRISIENGIINIEENGRLSITKDVQDVLRPILSQYDESSEF